MIPTIISQALTNEKIHLGNLESRRDFTFVSDTVDGFIHVAQTSDVEGDTFNLGTGTEISIGDLAQLIIDLIGRQVEIIEDSERIRPGKSEVQRLLSDSTLARERLGWEPMVSIEDGLYRTIAWISENIHLYDVGVYKV